jgi:poly(A) polymerase
MKLREIFQQMREVQKRIGASTPMICGGVPRDRYMGRLDHISDIDITTGDKTADYISQEFAIELKKKYNVTRKVMPDGHSTIFIGNLKLDFSSNFVVSNIDELLSKRGIAKPIPLQKEIFSRDFTCNALLLSLDMKNLFDLTKNGFKDIKERKIRTCLSPDITLTSNRNRVIRAVYLAAKLDFDVDDSIITYVQKNPSSVRIATDKVLADKMNEAFTYDADKASTLLTKMNLWNYVPVTEKVYPYYIRHVKGGVNVAT